MRLDEWQKYIDSEFVGEGKVRREKEQEPDSGRDAPPAPSEEIQASSPKLEPIPEPQEQSGLGAEGRNGLQTALDAPRIDRVASVNTDLDSVIPSFDRYLPSRHPANEPQEQAEPADSSPTSQTTAELEHSLPRQDSIAALKTREPVTTSLQPQTDLIEEDHSNGEDSSVRRERLLFSLAALGRLYETASKADAETAGESPRSKRVLLERLMNPILTMDEAAQLLGISPATIRRYTNQGVLACFRQGAQHADANRVSGRESRHRRFRLADILTFLETRQATLQADLEQEQAQKEKGRTWLV